jgi:large subunit ribosomal protein L44
MSSQLSRSPRVQLTYRLLAETGRHTQSPIFSIGLFLPSGLKLAEGHGASLSMAEHRAAVNALHSLYLVRSDAGASTSTGGAQAQGSVLDSLPTASHGQWALEAGKVGRGSVLRGKGIQGGMEGVVESARR